MICLNEFIIYLPWMTEVLQQKADPALNSLLSRSSALSIHMLLDYLPKSASESEVKTWFNEPADNHLTYAGAVVYANSMDGLLKDCFMGRPK